MSCPEDSILRSSVLSAPLPQCPLSWEIDVDVLFDAEH